MRHATSLNLVTRPLRVEMNELSKLRCPAILHWDLNHFVVLKKLKRGFSKKSSVIILDPALGERKLSLEEAANHFTGVALECLPNESFKKNEEPNTISVKNLIGKVNGLRGAVIKVIALAVALEVFAIVSPLFNQFVIDEVIISGDQELLKLLIIGFAIVLITQTSISMARSWFLTRWTIDVGFQWTTRILLHLTKLPVSFFEKRHLGDIVSKFGSIAAIQSTVSAVLLSSFLDGLMAIFALFMMFLYSVKLTAVVLVGVLAYCLLRWAFYAPLREAARERIILAAKENSNFMETIRAIVPLKLFGGEAERVARWHNLKQDVINRDVETQKLGLLASTFSTAISGAQNLMTFYIGATLVMQNGLTVGMLMAFSSYSGTFTSRVFKLIDLYVSIRMLTMHTSRLADIVLEEIEPEPEVIYDTTNIMPSITLKDVRFRYSDGEPWVLDGINLQINSGEIVALIGPSGSGKTTLCKIILGLISPVEGTMYVGGIDVKRLGMPTYRKMIGSVMQEDVLLSGSIQDNIAFFDGLNNTSKASECADIACISNEILAMPMGYHTFVGDLGSSLSGGQKQRILLARALYKEPKILVLDEATSHLDIGNEEEINKSLKALNMTRIMIAHRPNTINAAQRVISIANGKALELQNRIHSEEIHLATG